MRKQLKRSVSLLLTLVMIIGLLPTAALAVDEGATFSQMQLYGFTPYVSNTQTGTTTTVNLLAEETPGGVTLWENGSLVWPLGALETSVGASNLALTVTRGNAIDRVDRYLKIELAKGLEFTGSPDDYKLNGADVVKAPQAQTDEYGYEGKYGALLIGRTYSSEGNNATASTWRTSASGPPGRSLTRAPTA